MFHSALWWTLSSFVAQGAFLKVSAKQWMLNCVGQLDDFCDLSFSESFLIPLSCGLAGVSQVSQLCVLVFDQIKTYTLIIQLREGT